MTGAEQEHDCKDCECRWCDGGPCCVALTNGEHDKAVMRAREQRPKARDELLNLLSLWGLTTGKGSRAHADRILELHEAELAEQWSKQDVQQLEYLRPDETVRWLEGAVAELEDGEGEEGHYVALPLDQAKKAVELLRRYRAAFVNASVRARANSSAADRYVTYGAQLRNALQDSLLGTMAGVWDKARQEARVTALWALVQTGNEVAPNYCGNRLDEWVCCLKPGLHPFRKHRDATGHWSAQTVCPDCGDAWGNFGHTCKEARP
jgi:hypothetical protein